jgi:hypothetical protein
VLRWSVRDEEIGQAMKHVVGSEPPGNDDCQASARELIKHDEHAESATVVSTILDEVVRPDVVRPLRSETYARPVVEPEAAPFWLFHRYFQPFPAPDAIDALDVDPPALGNEHLADAPIAVTAVSRGEPHDVGRQCRFVVSVLSCRLCVARGYPTTAHARRSETASRVRTCAMHARLREGLSIFPRELLSGSTCRASVPIPPFSAASSSCTGE